MDAIRPGGWGETSISGKVGDARRLARSRILVSVRVFLTERH